MNKPKHFRTVREFRNYMAECAIRDREQRIEKLQSWRDDKSVLPWIARDGINKAIMEIIGFQSTIK